MEKTECLIKMSEMFNCLVKSNLIKDFNEKGEIPKLTFETEYISKNDNLGIAIGFHISDFNVTFTFTNHWVVDYIVKTCYDATNDYKGTECFMLSDMKSDKLVEIIYQEMTSI